MRRGFSLIELLVVVSVIALLVALLLPSFAQARRQALAVRCGTNLKDLGVALASYIVDEGHYPALRCDRPRALVWPMRLRRYTGGGTTRQLAGGHEGQPTAEVRVFWCPAEKDPYRWRPEYRTTDVLGATGHPLGYAANEVVLDPQSAPFSYGYNDVGSLPITAASASVPQLGLGLNVKRGVASEAWTELPGHTVVAPAEMIALADSTSDGYWDGSIRRADLGSQPAGGSALPGKRHYGGAQVLLADGHVVRMLQARMIEDKDWARKRWNNTNRPLPD